MATAIPLVLALLPTIVIMFIVLVNEKHKKEPFKKILSVFAISALSTIPAAILEVIGQAILTLIMGGLFGNSSMSDETFSMIFYFLEYVLVVGVCEESCKFFTFKWIIFHDREFDNTYDGVVYGAASALGFATLENLMYIFVMSNDPVGTAIMRAILSIPMHAITGIFMGYYFGISKYRKYNFSNDESHPERYAFVFSVILHGIYDFVVTVPGIYEDNDSIQALSFIILAALMIFIYVMIGITVHRAKKNTHNIYNRFYYEQLDGMLQDMYGGKTTNRKRLFGVPLPMNYRNAQNTFNPYNPYAYMGGLPPQYPQFQQQYNPYAQQYQASPPQYGQQGYSQSNIPPYYQQPTPPTQGFSQNTASQKTVVRVVPRMVAPSDLKPCPNCGNVNPLGSSFCARCGNRLDT